MTSALGTDNNAFDNGTCDNALSNIDDTLYNNKARRLFFGRYTSRYMSLGAWKAGVPTGDPLGAVMCEYDLEYIKYKNAVGEIE